MFQLLAANPFGKIGCSYFVEKLCNGNEALRVLDIHDSQLEPDEEEQVRQLIFLWRHAYMHVYMSHASLLPSSSRS